MKVNLKNIIITMLLFTVTAFATPRLAVQYWDEETQTEISGTWELYLADGTFVCADSTGANNLVDLTLNTSYRIKAAVSADNGSESYLHWNQGELTHISRWITFAANEDQVYNKHAYFMTQTSTTIQATDGVEIWIHDPWLTDANDEPYGQDHFVPLSQLAPNGSYNVFEGRGSSIEFMEYPYYKVKVKRLTATTSGIYRLYDDQNISLDYFTYNPGELELTAGYEENYYHIVDVLFHTGGTLDVNYEQINNQDFTVVHINVGENLDIEAGAEIEFAQNVSIDCEGELSIGSQNDSQVTLKSAGTQVKWDGIKIHPSGTLTVYETTFFNSGSSTESGMIKLISSSTMNCTASITNANFTNNEYGDIVIIGGAYNCDDPEPIEIKGCEFNGLYANTYGAVILDEAGRYVKIDKCKITHAYQAIGQNGLEPFTGRLEVRNSLFIREYSDYTDLESTSAAIVVLGIGSVIVQNNEFINALDAAQEPDYPLFTNTNIAVFVAINDDTFQTVTE